MMNFQRKKVAVAVGYALGAGGIAALAANSALAQDVRVDVTGTNIKRVESEGALPVQVITRADIEAQGIQNAAGVVDRLSANSSIGGLSLAGSEGTTGTGFAAASLRGLGSQRTLVLLNGKRIANTAFSGATVDLNSIPLSAIERVEVLTDGASAVYGTDAIAGVINFILRKDFTGVEAFAYYGDSEAGGGTAQHYNIAGGWGDLAKDKFNVYATVDYQKYDALAANQRAFSATSYLPFAPGGVFDRTSGNSIPGNVSLPAVPGRTATTQNPTYPQCLPPFSFGTLTASTLGQCRFDFASVIDDLPPSETWNVIGSAKWQINPDTQVYFDGSWSQTESTARVSPAPISSATILSGDPVLAVPSSPFYPTALATQYGVNGMPLEVFWRGLELGPRTDDNKIQQQRYVLGVQGNVKGWDYDTFFNWSQSKATDTWIAGWAQGSTLLPILNSGKVNLFGINTPDVIALMDTALIKQTVIDATGSTGEFQVKVSNDIYNLPAGPLGFALGYDYRREEYEFISAQVTQDADVPGLGGSISTVPQSSRNINAVFAEFNVPIVKTFEADFQVRFDDYQNVGNTTNGKIGLRWQPTKDLLVRGSAGTGFRAPSLPELFQPAQFGATGGNYNDPLRCPFTGSPRDCNAQFTTKLGGNPNLTPEKSTNYTAGVVWEPLRGFSAGLEYWYIKIKDVIGLPAEEPIFNNIVASEAAGLIVRYAPGSAGCANNSPNLPCPINYGVQTLLNISSITTSGLDINFNYIAPKQDWGNISFNFSGTYVYQWDQQTQGGDVQHLIGTYAGGTAVTVNNSGSTGAFPKWKHNLNLGYSYGPWQANLNQLFVNGYLDAGAARDVGDYSIWGLNGSYTGFKNFTLTVGVRNLLDTDPPYTRQSQSFQVGYDPAIADPLGRFWYGSIKYAFK